MENKDKNLVMKKANIKRLIKLRGKTLRDLSHQMEVSYTLLSHFISDATYLTEAGTICRYDPPHVKRAISDYLGVSYYDLWHGEGNKILLALIEIEIAKSVRVLVEQNRTLYKPKK